MIELTTPKLARHLGLVTVFGTAMMASLLIPADADAQNKQELWKDIGASERIDFAGRLHMLSQRIAASSCYITGTESGDLGQGVLMGSRDEIDRIMNALANGNARMGIIGAEEDGRVLGAIKTVSDMWVPVRSEIDERYENGTIRQSDWSFVAEWNEPYAQNASILVSEIAAQYSNPADLLQGDAILVDLAGRQRMRTQQMLKEACETWTGASDGAALSKSIGLYERTFRALKDGDTSVGIRPAASATIDDALSAIATDWEAVQPLMVSIAEGQAVSDDAQRELFLAMNEMLIKTDLIVTQYTKFVKHDYF